MHWWRICVWLVSGLCVDCRSASTSPERIEKSLTISAPDVVMMTDVSMAAMMTGVVEVLAMTVVMTAGGDMTTTGEAVMMIVVGDSMTAAAALTAVVVGMTTVVAAVDMTTAGEALIAAVGASMAAEAGAAMMTAVGATTTVVVAMMIAAAAVAQAMETAAGTLTDETTVPEVTVAGAPRARAEAIRPMETATGSATVRQSEEAAIVAAGRLVDLRPRHAVHPHPHRTAAAGRLTTAGIQMMAGTSQCHSEKTRWTPRQSGRLATATSRKADFAGVGWQERLETGSPSSFAAGVWVKRVLLPDAFCIMWRRLGVSQVCAAVHGPVYLLRLLTLHVVAAAARGATLAPWCTGCVRRRGQAFKLRGGCTVAWPAMAGAGECKRGRVLSC